MITRERLGNRIPPVQCAPKMGRLGPSQFVESGERHRTIGRKKLRAVGVEGVQMAVDRSFVTPQQWTREGRKTAIETVFQRCANERRKKSRRIGHARRRQGMGCAGHQSHEMIGRVAERRVIERPLVLGHFCRRSTQQCHDVSRLFDCSRRRAGNGEASLRHAPNLALRVAREGHRGMNRSCQRTSGVQRLKDRGAAAAAHVEDKGRSASQHCGGKVGGEGCNGVVGDRNGDDVTTLRKIVEPACNGGTDGARLVWRPRPHEG